MHALISPITTPLVSPITTQGVLLIFFLSNVCFVDVDPRRRNQRIILSLHIINSFEFANEQQLLMNGIVVQVASQGMKSARVNRRSFEILMGPGLICKS